MGDITIRRTRDGMDRVIQQFVEDTLQICVAFERQHRTHIYGRSTSFVAPMSFVLLPASRLEVCSRQGSQTKLDENLVLVLPQPLWERSSATVLLPKTRRPSMEVRCASVGWLRCWRKANPKKCFLVVSLYFLLNLCLRCWLYTRWDERCAAHCRCSNA